MKLICEVQEQKLEFVTEAKEDGEKEYFIEGIFMQADIKNRNGRVYPVETLQKDVVKNSQGNKSAGVRARKGLRQVKKMATDIVRLSLETDKS